MTTKAIRNLIIFIFLILIIAYASLTLFTDATLMPIPHRHSINDICQSHLLSIKVVLLAYSSENNKYPKKDKWCDLLIENADASPKVFKCPNDKNGQSSYALNPNAKPNSPGNIVLIFEAKPGWNQYGGKELLNPDNHKGTGSNILFNNGRVEFINEEDFWKLNWGIPQEPNKIQNIKQ